MLEQDVEGVPSASTPGACLAIDEVFHPANKRLGLARPAKSVISAFGISWNDSSGERNGHFAPFEWRGA